MGGWALEKERVLGVDVELRGRDERVCFQCQFW